MRVPSGKMTTAWPRSERASEVATDSSPDAPRLTGNAPEAVQDPASQRFFEQLALGHEEIGRPGQQPITKGSRKLRWLEASSSTARRYVLAPQPPKAEVDEDRGLHDPAHGPVHERVHAAPARALVVQR